MTVDDLFAILVAAEVFALASRRVPTVTALCRQHRALAPVALAVIGAHLLSKPAR